jgi:hypothetical protein
LKREESMFFLQAGVFKCGVMGKEEVGKGGCQDSMARREDRGRCWRLAGKAIRLGSFACCFSLTLLSGVAIFTLFQCSSAFQHSNSKQCYNKHGNIDVSSAY